MDEKSGGDRVQSQDASMTSRVSRTSEEDQSGAATLAPVTDEQVRKALEASRGSVTVAALALGISRQTVYRLINKYGIQIDRVIR